MVKLIYLIVVLIATSLGSLAGIGGGVIIKPLFDFMNYHNIETISFLSSFAVFTMAIVAIYKQYRSGVTIKGKTSIYLGLGSVFGGILGKELFSYVLIISDKNEQVKGIQAFILLLLLIFVYLYLFASKKVKTYYIESSFLTLFIGIMLGLVASFLGIGGGPINVALLSIFFSMNIKDAAIHSIIIIFFSQLSKLSFVYLDNKFREYDLSLLLYIVPAAIIGGLIGTYFNRKLEKKTISYIFKSILIIIILINIFNAYISYA